MRQQYIAALRQQPLWWWIVVALAASIGGSALADLVLGVHATGLVAVLVRGVAKMPGTLFAMTGLVLWVRRMGAEI